jgi:predicted dehydrogenase
MNKWWVPGLSIGYEHSFIHQAADFLKGLESGASCAPTFKEALQTQMVCEAVIESANSRSWKNIASISNNNNDKGTL